MSEQPPWGPYGQQHPGQGQGQPPHRRQPPYQGQLYGPPGGQAPDPGPGPQPPPRQKRHLVRDILAGVGGFVVGGIVISAISPHGSGVSTTSSESSPIARPTVCPVAVHIATPASVGSHFGVQDGNGHTYQVTLVKVIDPATSANKFNTPDRGYHLVGAVFRIKALSGSPQNENADADATVIGSDGRTYTFNIRLIAGYANFSGGMLHVAQRETTTGAVTFQVPDGIKVVKVKWRADRGIGSIVQWNVPR